MSKEKTLYFTHTINISNLHCRYFIMSTHYESWYLINADNKNLGRLATRIAKILIGKNKTTYLPYLNNNNYIVVINAGKIYVSGKKTYKKFYYSYSKKPGKLKAKSFIILQRFIPNKIIKLAVKGMLPKNLLGKKLLTNLRIYNTSEHPHSGQQPTLIEI
uniref:Ribosomal protein L13 n=1 Tax=Apophlaea sinclairii TaxID=212746 RepID=A0A1C9CBV5_9FLOR|nr:ribosomal protein L13 [Apophlaea sinclairii]AOM65857.1 ribosomal protein L13 [Apophlaea sinclairii]